MFKVIPFVLYSMLNLLDRASTPITILNTAKQALKPQGKLIPIQSDYNCCCTLIGTTVRVWSQGRDGALGCLLHSSLKFMITFSYLLAQ